MDNTLSKKYYIQDISNWEHEFMKAIIEFKEQYKLLPSYIAASEQTHTQIDFITNYTPARYSVSLYNAPKNKNQYIRLTHFAYEKRFIELVSDSNMEANTFTLEYDAVFEYHMGIVEAHTYNSSYQVA